MNVLSMVPRVIFTHSSDTRLVAPEMAGTVTETVYRHKSIRSQKSKIKNECLALMADLYVTTFM